MLPKSVLAITVVLGLASAGPADYALRDGDTVVFLGDSITAARIYGKIVENYTLLRFPERRVRFINAGWGGDTAAGGLARLERDVLQRGATVLIVAYGFNDIGWGLRADDLHKQKYLDAIRGVVERCRESKIRVFICSAAITAEDPAKSETGFFQKMCDEGMALARALGEQSIDVQRGMREIHKKVWAFNERLKDEKGKTSLHAADGVHLNDLGQLAMAFAILKGLGAPAEVSAAIVDVAEAKVVDASGCKISDLKCTPASASFRRLDDGKPINFGLFGALQFRFVPIPDQLNRYLLAVRNLADGKYEVRANERLVGTFTNKQLAAGLNIASLTPDPWQPGGPWDADATILSRLTEARSDLEVARLFTGLYLPGQANRPALEGQMSKINAALEELQRTLVQPIPYDFTVRAVAEKNTE